MTIYNLHSGLLALKHGIFSSCIEICVGYYLNIPDLFFLDMFLSLQALKFVAVVASSTLHWLSLVYTVEECRAHSPCWYSSLVVLPLIHLGLLTGVVPGCSGVCLFWAYLECLFCVQYLYPGFENALTKCVGPATEMVVLLLSIYITLWMCSFFACPFPVQFMYLF